MTDHKWAMQFVESRGGALDEKLSSPAVRNLAECYLELWERQKVHALDCDMDEDCSCEPQDPPVHTKKIKR